MREYTHWLVTKGKEPGGDWRSYTPILLLPQTVSLKELRLAARAEVERRAMIFLPADVTTMDRLKALGGNYAARSLGDVWVRQVRLSSNLDDVLADEAGLPWCLRGSVNGIPYWQGPADGVIPRSTPVTVYKATEDATKLELVD